MQSAIHRQCSERWHFFKQSKEGGTVILWGHGGIDTLVLAQVSNSHMPAIDENREYATKIILLLLYMAKQGIALRGHDEREESKNRGNFLELCNVFSQFDEAFAKKLRGYFNFTGHSTQNELLHIAADIVKSRIIQKVQENGFFTVLVTEARSFKQEEMTVCVRYTENLEIKERFLGFVDSSERGDAGAIYQSIKQFLQASGIANLPVVAQCYDGAAVMASHINSVQQKMLQDHPTAIYIHSMTHKLNLVLVQACKVNQTATGFFDTLESLFAFFSQPATHPAYLEAQKTLGIKLEMCSLSDTRWACRWKTVSAIKNSMRALLSCLLELSEPPYRRFNEACGLLYNVQKMDFCVCLIVFYHVLSVIHIAQKALQTQDATLSQACSVLQRTVKELESMRISTKWDAVWEEAQKFHELLHEVPTPGADEGCAHKRCVKKTAFLECSAIMSTLEQQECQPDKNESAGEKWGRRLYFPVLNTLLGECDSRFSSQSLEIAKSVEAVLKCDPDGIDGLLSKYANALSINSELAHTEMKWIKMDLPAITLEGLKAAASTKLYPNFTKLLKLALTLPVGTATCERSFSAMRRIQNWMRSTMGQKRLSDLCLLHVESDLTEGINPHQIIDAYAAKSGGHPRRLLFTDI
uniref:Uncharacterized protein n=1 Tax=Pelusios castaneus TaxID=367368 RepID=A0A8C8SNW1_9SAUR